MNRFISAMLPALLLVLLFAPAAWAGQREGMREDRAVELVLQADDRATDRARFFVYPEGDGAWVFYEAGVNGHCSEGAFWYVSEARSVPLGSYSKNVVSFNYLKTQPGIMTSVIAGKDGNTLHAAVLKDGAPYEIKDLHGLTGMWEHCGSVYGVADDAYDKIFLALDGDRFVEIAGTPVARDVIDGLADVRSILDAVRSKFAESSVEFTEFLYRPAALCDLDEALGRAAGSIAVNLKIDGAPRHFFIWADATGAAHVVGEGTFGTGMFGEPSEIDIAIFDGYAPRRHDLGFETVAP